MKQEEFLEIIEQNKGKHRQPIETLIQGRRIGGIVGGGTTPEKPKLVNDAYYLCHLEMQSGEYFAFQALEEETDYFACEVSFGSEEQPNAGLNIYDNKGRFVRFDETYNEDEAWNSLVNKIVDYIDRITGQAIYIEGVSEIYVPKVWNKI